MPKGWETIKGGWRAWTLQRRPGVTGTIYRCRYDEAARQVRRCSLRTSDPAIAQQRLEDWINLNEGLNSH